MKLISKLSDVIVILLFCFGLLLIVLSSIDRVSIRLCDGLFIDTGGFDYFHRQEMRTVALCLMTAPLLLATFIRTRLRK